MATNKRKDAAALFELIDKSTLKVPKNASSLKIPNWWSSKAGSAGAAAPPAKAVRPMPRAAGSTVAAPAVAKAPALEVEGQNEVGTQSVPGAVPDMEAQAGELPAQPRLFDPPPANVMPVTTPSIRPPAAGGAAASAAVKVTTSEPPPMSEPRELPMAKADTAPTAKSDVPERPAVSPVVEKEKVKVIPPMPRAFMPPTMSRDKAAWSPRPGAFARLPMWVPVAASVFVIVLIVGIVIATRGGGKNQKSPETRSAGQGLTTATGVSMERGGGSRGLGQRGVIYNPGEFQHFPERYYIIICSTPSQKVAQDYGNWLADHGVSVSIEITQAGSGTSLMYTVVSAFDFPTATAAASAVTEIKRVGGLLKISPNPFKDAQQKSGLSSPGAAAASRGAR